MRSKIEKANMSIIKREHFNCQRFCKNDNIIIKAETKSIGNDETIN